jgi:hypothetical protein
MTLLTVRRLSTAALLLVSTSLGAQARSFRYAVSDQFGDTKFTGEIKGSFDPLVRHYEVKYDADGRIAGYASMRNGVPVSRVVYSYAENSSRPSGYENIAATGEVSGSVKIQRNARGDRVRAEQFTTIGKLTRYITRQSAGDSAVELLFTADDTKLSRTISWFGSNGTPVRTRSYPNDTTYYESDIDPETGLETVSRKYQGATLVVNTKSTYDADGSLTRSDIYTPEGVWYGGKEYVEGLLAHTLYKFADGTTEETRTTYDEKRRAIEASFRRNGVLICNFKYERHPNGALNRTLAVAPDGSLMGEYPNILVGSVLQNGEALDHPGAGILHKKGNWW